MKLVGQIPVEQLDDERLANIERRIVAGAAERLASPERAPRRVFAFAAVAAAVAAAMLVGWQLRGEAPRGDALPAIEAAQTFAIHTTGESSTVELDGATIAADPASALEVTRGAGEIVVHMGRGRIELAIEHREGRTVIVRAGDTEIEDIGTKFSVAYDGASAVDVRVTEGRVKVTHQAKSELVAAGFAWSTASGLVAIADVPAPVPASTHATTTIAVADPPPVLHDRHAAVPPATAVIAAAPPRARPAGIETPAAPARQTERAPVSSDPYVELKQAVHAQPIAFDPRVDGPGDAATEVAKLKPVAYAPQKYGEEASRALYEMAVLLHKPLHQDSEALRTLELYQARFGSHGKELAAVLWLRVRITCGHAIDDDCRKAAYSYQHAVPTGAAADVAIRITNAQ